MAAEHQHQFSILQGLSSRMSIHVSLESFSTKRLNPEKFSQIILMCVSSLCHLQFLVQVFPSFAPRKISEGFLMVGDNRKGNSFNSKSLMYTTGPTGLPIDTQESLTELGDVDIKGRVGANSLPNDTTPTGIQCA